MIRDALREKHPSDSEDGPRRVGGGGLGGSTARPIPPDVP